MGYCIDQVEQDFFIAAKNIPDVVKAIHKLWGKDDLMGGSCYHNNVTTYHYSWVDMSFNKKDNIKDVFDCWRWHIEADPKTKDIIKIYFDGEKLGDEYVLFCAIAPYVKSGSYIEMRGEDNDNWRWAFQDGKCMEIRPTVSWD